MNKIILTVSIALLIIATNYAQNNTEQVARTQKHAKDHFDAKGNEPSKFTIEKWENLKNTMPFEDKKDFEEQKKGFIAAPEYRQIMADAGHVAWDMGKYNFLFDGKDYASIHPSLKRQAILNMNYGLYEVTSGIYQVRGFDITNITFIKGKTGWIVFDPLTAKETARAALKLINEQLGERPVVAVIYSHSHADHFGGVKGVVNEEDVKSGKVKIIAPEGFMYHAIAEFVHSGNIMTRRMFYQYGFLLPVNQFGHLDQAIGKKVSAGNLGLIEPNVYIKNDIEKMTIDGIKMVFQNTPGTEAPVEMNTYFPEMKAFWAAENIVGTIHNIYTLRGALVRDALAWSQSINKALYLFGQDAEVMFASHTWPRWGNERIQEVMKGQRDTYGHLNNNVMHLANQGVTINEIHNVYKVPKSLQNQWYARSYHGSVEHNSRAVINRYLGYWDSNPATLIPLSPRDSAPLYVEMMGGSVPIINKGQELYNQGKYKYAVEILDKLIFADPKNQKAKDLLADCYEQIGYQQESPSLRNSFLAAALELRNGVPKGVTPGATGPDMTKAITTQLWFEYLGILLNSEKAVGKQFVINFITPDNDEKFVLSLSNSMFSSLQGFQDENPDLTVTINRSDVELIMLKKKSFEAMIKDGTAKTKGDVTALNKLFSSLDKFDMKFEILPGTMK